MKKQLTAAVMAAMRIRSRYDRGRRRSGATAKTDTAGTADCAATGRSDDAAIAADIQPESGRVGLCCRYDAVRREKRRVPGL